MERGIRFLRVCRWHPAAGVRTAVRKRRRPKKHGLYEIAVSRAASDALYEKLVDECWEEITAVLDDPKVRKARRQFLRSVVEAMARRDGEG